MLPLWLRGSIELQTRVPTVASVWRCNHLLSAYDESSVVHTLDRLSIGGYVAFNTHSVTVHERFAYSCRNCVVCHRPIPNRPSSLWPDAVIKTRTELSFFAKFKFGWSDVCVVISFMYAYALLFILKIRVSWSSQMSFEIIEIRTLKLWNKYLPSSSNPVWL